MPYQSAAGSSQEGDNSTVMKFRQPSTNAPAQPAKAVDNYLRSRLVQPGEFSTWKVPAGLRDAPHSPWSAQDLLVSLITPAQERTPSDMSLYHGCAHTDAAREPRGCCLIFTLPTREMGK